MADFIQIAGERFELVEADPGPGQMTYAEAQAKTPAEQAAAREQAKEDLADAIADKVAEGRNVDFVLGRLIFETLKAARTNDFTFFDGVTNAATFKAFVRQLIRDRLDQ